ncbi:uncharacterized protein L969DRAFT_47599 [Mixia osmundae IAM 14324]|uniref:Mannose-P-dolichol utilization defect 1 protein homolog n=1 Tax=Mixia osmundae (strain CBS 9802 / IAM 14324 / JCM 22182 / KY 12970) TaxID=764103 RepID=G7E6J0_MIXOS|nr:uncharacterized protein L969DRAFT_47599 [Mixia osmundae IAM 14324]KEI40391.1 hypothetical protein L969DRAFT_47599 [Mixia osmundae IAM 14324]GAA98450.1 hypothetical protein E5Q_05136 [Mixia osmundae IAM 14324]
MTHFVQSITHNLPGFIRDPAVALLGQECYTTLIYNVDLDDRQCLTLALSKTLGVGLVAGGAIVKLPQIIKIVRSKSARGISLTSFLLDTAGLLIVLAYNVRLGFPFSTWGENLFLFVQNFIIISLILGYSARQGLHPKAPVSSSHSKTTRVLPFWVGMALVTYLFMDNTPLIPTKILRGLLTLTIPLAISSKLPQIVTNAKNGSTGQLSSFLVFNSFAGCVARLFTTQTETGDATLWWGFLVAALANGILALQMLYYWNTSSPMDAYAAQATVSYREKEKAEQQAELAAIKATAPETRSVGTGTRKASGPKWVRKPD